MKKQSWNDIAGESVAEKMQALGVTVGQKSDIRKLGEIADACGIEAVVYFEKDLAETSTYEDDLKNFAGADEFCRPFVLANSFIAFASENDPSFPSRLKEFPMMIQVIEVGERTEGSHVIPYIKGLMPFLDDFDVDAEPEGTFIE
ncbi:hypothetical protein [Methanogenium organophilum]|uniref:Uncharacterized protein n=1 Tax=Methanogenium organophilum TaxID=2199 RepID=A0A9X9S347_METOG|nr:hypothetical protein [Methanogenium organophilum]WAI00918.1 hypothetical protein OU421_10925 [Methanogenium organophilum]